MTNPVIQKIRNYCSLIGEGAFDLGVNLVVMVMVQRSLGVAGLGIFSYLISLLVFAGFLSEFGISGYLEREIAITRDNNARRKVLEDAARAIFITSLIGTAVFFAGAVPGMSLTRVNERAVAYIIIGITILFRNINRIRMAVLQGSGEYQTAARLKILKRLYLLGVVFILLQWKLPPSYLMLGYLAGEIGLLIKSRKKVRLPETGSLIKGYSRLRQTLEKSAGFILTDDALDVIFYMDFLLLGFFVSSGDLGVYAQASILVRMFLLIPMSIRPFFLGQYCTLASENRLMAAAGSFKSSAACLFFLHSVMALYILLFFSDILGLLFHGHRMSPEPFYLFAEILPGLLFFSAVASQESLYEAAGQVVFLQKTIITVAAINFCLNVFCIPFGGFFGAAFATTVSMFAYFMVFGRHLAPVFQIDKINYICAGAAVYLTFMLFQALEPGFWVTLVSVPVVLFFLLTLMGFFSEEPKEGLQADRGFFLSEK